MSDLLLLCVCGYIAHLLYGCATACADILSRVLPDDSLSVCSPVESLYLQPIVITADGR